MVNIIFLHPDLGIGGAERLVVDAGLALKQKGHKVSYVTNHHDPDHCFLETRDGTFPVTTVADWFPRSFFGKFTALCAYIRFILAALYLVISIIPVENTDLVFCDQISVVVPILKLFSKVKVVFYCHFPDQLLSKPGGIWKKVYRKLINFLEERTTGMAHKILVNSNFTSRTFHETFKSLRRITPFVLYPSINTELFDTIHQDNRYDETIVQLTSQKIVFVSLNRFDFLKNHRLAIEAFALLEDVLDPEDWERAVLFVAGGYDTRVKENIMCYDQLDQLIKDRNLSDKVYLMKSIDDFAKVTLLRHCHTVVYTPSNEHFGIVPLEAMYCEKPVVAVNSGGPTETVIDTVTGYLVPSDPEQFAAKMKLSLVNGLHLGQAGKRHYEQNFGYRVFGEKLSRILFDLLHSRNAR